MAKGDIYTANDETVADNALLTVQPAAGQEVQIHNIYWGTTAGSDAEKIEIYRHVGSTDYKIQDANGLTALLYAPNSIPVYYLLTNTDYIKIKNVSGGEMTLIGCDGVERKPAT